MRFLHYSRLLIRSAFTCQSMQKTEKPQAKANYANVCAGASVSHSVRKEIRYSAPTLSHVKKQSWVPKPIWVFKGLTKS